MPPTMYKTGKKRSRSRSNSRSFDRSRSTSRSRRSRSSSRYDGFLHSGRSRTTGSRVESYLSKFQNADHLGFYDGRYIPTSYSYRGTRAGRVRKFLGEQRSKNKSKYRMSFGPHTWPRKSPEEDKMISALGKSHERKSPRSRRSSPLDE